jgi:hypothetical protein
MNRLCLVFRLPQPPICPVCGDSLQGEATVVREGFAMCGLCEDTIDYFCNGQVSKALSGMDLPGVWATDRGVRFLVPSPLYIPRVSILLQMQCGLVDHPASTVFPDGDAI